MCDLKQAASPIDVATVLASAAQDYRESAGELRSMWQDKSAGAEWDFIAREFERLAKKIEKRWGAA